MVSFLKNFALGALTGLNANVENKKAKAQQEADDIRRAKLQFDYADKLASHTADYQQEKEIAKLREEDKIKREQAQREMDAYQQMTGGGLRMPGVAPTPTNVPTGTPTDTMPAPLPDAPTAQPAPLHPSQIDNGTPYDEGDDPVRNDIIRQYQVSLARNDVKGVAAAHTALVKHDQDTKEKDPVRKGEDDFKTKLSKRDAMVASGQFTKEQADQAALGIKPPSDDDNVTTRKYREKADLNSDALKKAVELQDFMMTHPGITGILPRLRSAGYDFTSQTAATKNIFNKVGITDPNQVKDLQKYTTLHRELLAKVKKPMSGGDSSISNMDTAIVDAALGDLGANFTSEDRANVAINTITEGLHGEVKDSILKLQDPSIGGQVKRLQGQLDQLEGTGTNTTPSLGDAPKVTGKDDPVYQKLNKGDTYIGPDGQKAQKQ